MDVEQQTTPLLEGNFAPWRSEGDVPDLRVVGELPRDLDGTYLRNGPNPAFPPRHRYHWFDGDGMIHAISLRDGKASYRNRYVSTEGLRAEQRAGRALYGGLLDMRSEVLEGAPIKNAANTNIVFHAGRLLALYELGLPTEVDPRTLGTRELYDFGGALRTPMTAHPKIDPDTGEMIFFGYSPTPPYLTYHVAGKDGRLARSEEVEIEWSSAMHDFAMTREHVIFILCPLVMSIEHMVATGTPVRWEPERGTRVGVMPRRGGSADVRWFSTDPGYVFRALNAYVDGARIVLDVVRYASLDPTFAGRLNADSLPRLERWRIDLTGGGVTREPLGGSVVEFPRIDDRRLGVRHRYGYLAASDAASFTSFTAIHRYDFLTGRCDQHDFGTDAGCGEPIFVPRGPTAGEDEGYVITLVYDGSRDASSLVILDARDVRAKPIASVQMPHRIPYGFHGNWLPAS